MTWDDLKFVLAVYRSGNATAAAATLNVSHATVSRRISEIETTLDIVLVDRSGVTWRPTPICAQIASEAEEMELKHAEALRLADAYSSGLGGSVRISAPTGTVVSILAQTLTSISEIVPETSLIFQTEDSLTDVSARKADIAIRFTQAPDQDLIGKQVGFNRWGFYCGKQFHPTIETELASKTQPRVPLLTSDPSGGYPDWAVGVFHSKSTCHYVYGFAEKAALSENGLGVAMIPRIIGDMSNQLRLIGGLPCTLRTPLWVLANTDTRHSKRIALVKRVLIDGLQQISDRLDPPD
ncbi:LysR family transcriptional regulator [uncultured Tateyamaria sp.]|uniref:LysR family transcriptional regulator n=1 Tax=uncultured Tateyamaria sp. TaxID=455651 RepID=UPI002606EFA2|nr:LysR family transcriptional regulator [uncultured Tateyamaria sp.]